MYYVLAFISVFLFLKIRKTIIAMTGKKFLKIIFMDMLCTDFCIQSFSYLNFSFETLIHLLKTIRRPFVGRALSY